MKKKKRRLLWFHFSSVESFWNHKNLMILFETVKWTKMLVHEFGFKSSSSKRGRLVSFKLIYIWSPKAKHIPWKREALWITSNISMYSRLNQHLFWSHLSQGQKLPDVCTWCGSGRSSWLAQACAGSCSTASSPRGSRRGADALLVPPDSSWPYVKCLTNRCWQSICCCCCCLYHQSHRESVSQSVPVPECSS